LPASQLPKVKRLFLELDTEKTGKLAKAQVTTGLEKLGLDHAIARETAEFMDMSRNGVVCWTEFVASCLNLGSGFYEDDLERLFKAADVDSDGLLSRQDLSNLLLADQLREPNAVCDIFVDLVGRRDDGARIDWHTFRKHFETGVTGSCCMAAGAPPQPTTQMPSHSEGTHSFLEQASAFVDGMRDLLWPEQKQRQPEQPSEGDLQRLAEMGFTDREKCKAALQCYWNVLSPLVIEQLCREDAGSNDVRNGL
jgi:Ca2+-binding EF-hand superfamily protein